MVNYKLTYFDIYGRGESIRMVFAHAGVAFEDNRIPKEAWPALKATTPFGQLPILEVDGAPIAQSCSILRFLGKQFDLTGKTPLEEARLDMFIDQLNDFSSDIKKLIIIAMGFDEGDQEQLRQELFIPNRDKHFALFKKNLTGDFILEKITWADIHLANSLSAVAYFVPDAFDGFPELKAYVDRVLSTPRLKAYIESRPPRPI